MGADTSTAPLGSSRPKKQVPIFHQILVVLHGSRKCGKTSLLRRMNGLNFQPQYTPTKCLQASEIIWHPICMPNEAIKIVVWDVVDKAIDPTPQTQRTKQLPDATNVDTFSRADGIIVVYDPRDEDSIKYARSILDQVPQSKPSLIVMNFADSFETNPSVPSLMEPYTNSFFHLTASMKTNQGLAELANWLDLPMNVSLSKIYELHLKQAEEKLNNLKNEFNLTGLNEESADQSSQFKNKGNSKDFWANDDDDRKDDTLGIGTGEVPADFFMDDDESDLRAKQNLEKLKKKLNLTEIEEDEEDIDEEMKLKMAKKKSKILSKPTNADKTQSKTISKPDQTRVQDEKEYNSDSEYNEDDNTNKPPQQPALANISFDIPEVAVNDNSFFEDDKIENKEDKELENDDIDGKLEELKKKLNLEIPKEEEDKEEKPKVKKSKILPKVKPPQIIIKPAQSQPKIQSQQKQPEITEDSQLPNSQLEKIQNEEVNQIESQKIEITNVSNEKENFFSDESENKEININQDENKTSNKFDIIVPSLNDEINNNNNTNKEAKITLPSFEDENILNAPNEQKEDIDNRESEEENKPNSENNIDNDISKIDSETKPNTNDFDNITFPSFGDDNFLPSNESKNDSKEETTSVSIPTISDITFPSFGNDDFFGDGDENDETDNHPDESQNLDISKHDEEEEIKKIEKKSKILPKKEPSVSQNKNDINKDDSESMNTTATTPASESVSNSIQNEISDQKQIPEITLPSFGDDSNFFSDDDKNENKQTNNPTFPSFEINFDDNNKTSNFFSDDDNLQSKEEKVENDNINEEIQKKKKSIILPKQNTRAVSTVTSIDEESNKQNNENKIDSLNLDSTLPDIQDNDINNDSFFTASSTNSQEIAEMPPPPPIDFSNSFLSEKQSQPNPITALPVTNTDNIINNSLKPQQNQSVDSDLDIINAIRKQEAEKAEKARQNAALLQARNVSIENDAQIAPSNTDSTPVSSQAASYSQMGDYEAFDETPQTSTREKKHRKHGSSSHRSRRHKSGRKEKTEESDGQNEAGGENNESYLTFD